MGIERKPYSRQNSANYKEFRAPDLLHSRIIRPFDWSMVHESEESPVCSDGLDADDHAYRRILREGYTCLDILDPISILHIVRFLRAGRHTSDRKNSRLL